MRPSIKQISGGGIAYFIMLHDGRIELQRLGKTIILDSPIVLSHGEIVLMDGTICFVDGTKKMLGEGELYNDQNVQSSSI